MTANLIRYAFAATRARGMFAGFLQKEDYQQLLKAQGLAEFEKVLRKLYPAASSSQAMRHTQEAKLDPAELEDRVTGHFLEIARQIIRSVPAAEGAFIRALVAQYEVFNSKALLRGRISNTPADKIRSQIIPLGSLAIWDWEELLAEEEVPVLLGRIRSHPLGGRIAKAYMERYQKTHSLYALEAQIDLDYLAWLLQAAANFPLSLRALIGTRIDTINISWILRLKENFKMAPEEILVQLIPQGHYLDVKDLKKLAFEEDPKRLLGLIREVPWRRYLPADRLDLPLIETGLYRFVNEQCYRAFRRHALEFTGIAAFVLLAQAVAQDVVKILEATEYHLEREIVAPQLFYANAF